MSLKKVRKAWKTIDPGEILKRYFHLSGWSAEIADLVGGFIVAALLYFIIAPALLGANPPAVVVQSCSMEGYHNVGDVVILAGTDFDGINAPLVTLDSPISYTISPNAISEETQELVFPNGDRVALDEKGDVIVYDSITSGIQIIHRVAAKVRAADGEFLITKGDANNLPDSVRVECAAWAEVSGGQKCTELSASVSRLCTEADAGWPGCLATPVTMDKVAGKQLVIIPLVGHVKMLFFHVITLGNGYPDRMWC